MRRRRAGGAAAVLVGLLLGGCGLPADARTQPVPDADVPYGLVRPSAASATALTGVAGRPREFWLRADDSAQGVRVRLAASEPRAQLTELLRLLSAGPSAAERAAGLGTALSPTSSFSVLGVRAGVVDVDVRSGGADPAPDRLPLAVGQVVLTVTSVPGVSAVRIFREGRLAQGPLPGGATTDLPLTADDYAALRRPAAASATTPATSPSPATS